MSSATFPAGRRPAWRIGLPCVTACFLAALAASGQVLVVGRKVAGGAISFQAVEEFQINARTQVRFLPEPKGAVESNVIGRLKKYELGKEWAQFGGIIRSDGSGRLIHWKGPERATEIVLPDNYSIKGSAQPAAIPGPVTLILVHSKKNKQLEMLDPSQFFVLVSGATADEAVLDFITKDWPFLNQREQFAAIEGFAKSFRGSPSVTEFRNALGQKLEDGLANFEDGKPYSDLVQLRPYGALAHLVFADDKPMVDLDETIVGRINFVEQHKALLRSLAVLGDWDELLAQYQDFERYQWSFPDLMALRQQALEESARAHSLRARAYAKRGDYQAAAAEAEGGQQRDPNNPEIADLVKAEKLQFSNQAAPRAELTRKVLDSESPDGRRFNQALFNADRAIQDKNFKSAEDALQEASRVDKDAPEVILLQARLLAAKDQLAEALPLLDQYDTKVNQKGERDKGDKVRFDVEYNLKSRKESLKQEIAAGFKTGEYSKLDQLLKGALIMDPGDSDFLYNGGVVAGVLRQTQRAQELLTKYLDHSDALDVDAKIRDKAWRIRNALTRPAGAKQQGTPDWMSGRLLAAGVYYCPESLAFQIPIDSVVGDKVRMAFGWDKRQLQSIRTTFDDEKGQRTYRLLLGDGPAAASAPTEKLGNFFFQYLSATGPLLKVATDPPAPGEVPAFQVKVVSDKQGSHLVDSGNAPILALWSSPYVDTQVLDFLGYRVAATVAGNSFFNPFLWDGVHYFTLRYDDAGRVESAQEWNADSTVRFTWDGDRLKEIRAYHSGTTAPYYRRTINYMGAQIQNEEFTLNGHNGKIRYVYDNRMLQKIEIDQDGKSWTAKPRM